MKQKGTYPVGYGRPPRQHRFRPGQSGNPKGRPRKKGPRNMTNELEDAFFDALERKVDVRINGKLRRMTTVQAIVMRLVVRAADGDFRAIKMVVDLMKSIGEAQGGREISWGEMVKLWEENHAEEEAQIQSAN